MFRIFVGFLGVHGGVEIRVRASFKLRKLRGGSRISDVSDLTEQVERNASPTRKRLEHISHMQYLLRYSNLKPQTLNPNRSP